MLKAASSIFVQNLFGSPTSKVTGEQAPSHCDIVSDCVLLCLQSRLREQ